MKKIPNVLRIKKLRLFRSGHTIYYTQADSNCEIILAINLKYCNNNSMDQGQTESLPTQPQDTKQPIKETRPQPNKQPMLRTLLKKLWGSIDASGGRIEQFDRTSVSKIINDRIIGGVKDNDNVFTTSTILRNGGRLGTWDGKEIYERNKEEYQAINRELSRLVGSGIIEMVKIKPNSDGDVIGYKVIDRKRLEEFSRTQKK